MTGDSASSIPPHQFSEPARQPSGVDSSVPNSARVANYWLGGKDNYAVDREAGEQYRQTFPNIEDISRAGRLFLGRAVRYLVEVAGIRQFLDIGAGLPTAANTHDIAQRAAPESRIVYVDNDPVVLAHARALLTSTPEGATAYIDVDVHEPEEVIAAAAETLDFARPVGLTMMGVLGHIHGDARMRSIVGRLLAPMVSGSYLLFGDGTNLAAAQQEAQLRYNESGAQPYQLRSPEQLAELCHGLHLVEPGLVSCPQWRPENPPADPPLEEVSRCALARKP